MKIDINKKYRTRGGMPVIIHGFNGPVAVRPLVYSYQAGDGKWFLDSCAEDGGDMDGDRMFDLIEVREPREFIIWIHPNGGTQRHEPVCAGWEGPIRVREILD